MEQLNLHVLWWYLLLDIVAGWTEYWCIVVLELNIGQALIIIMDLSGYYWSRSIGQRTYFFLMNSMLKGEVWRDYMTTGISIRCIAE